ncbi:MAG: T9SS type A sorting domain-containing protein, partial [Candidatus Paceibacterales bacterium]
YVQYKIKLKSNLPVGTQIQNTADIYFDLNAAVVTNTTVNTIALPTGITPVSDALNMQLYPNPAKNYIIVETDENAIGGTLQITDISGREVAKLQITNSRFRIPTSALSGGVYFVKLNTRTGSGVLRKLMVE